MNIDFTYIAIVLAVVFGSMVLHELMHGLTAYWLGDDTAKENGRLTLNPIKHIDPVLTIALPVLLVIMNGVTHNTPIFGGAKPVPFRPDRVKGGEWGAALVGVAGPLTNLVLAFLFFIAAYFSGHLIIVGDAIFATSGVMSMFLNAGIMVNLGFFAFNMLPIPPLDGSRLLYAVAPTAIQRFMESMERIGIVVVFAILLIASSFIGNILGGIIDFILKLFVAVLPI
ncbi:MAG: site-2 protease family protein [Sphaerimonospora mesophila]